MSGICATWRKHPGTVAEALASMIGGLALVPEERSAQEIAEAVGAGVSARFDGQQIYCDRRVLLVCDAELLNEKELGALCEEGNERADEAPVAGLLARLFVRFGLECFKKLRGAFSVIIWDQRDRRLFAAVDGFGIKRLAYYQNQQALSIATRVDALVRTGDVDQEINPRAIVNILNFTSNLAPETIFSKVQRLVPGVVLVASESQTRFERYWDLQYGVGGDSDEEGLSRRLESVVEKSVAAHCKADSFEGLGAFLSGGTDSSTVVGMMTRAARGPVHAFSIGFEEQPFNELGYAELAARRFGARHHTYLVGASDCFNVLPQMMRCFDEPFGNSSAIPTYFCARLAAEHGVRLLLTGDGGDELFGGNERYATDQIFEFYHRIPRAFRKGLIEPALRAFPLKRGPISRASGYVRRANIPGVERMLSYQFMRTHAAASIFEGDFLCALGDYTIVDIPASHYTQAPAGDHLDRLLYVDMKITLADNDLPKVTSMSELAGVQSRFPFLDRSVAEFSGRIPARLKVKGLEKRYLFKRAFRDPAAGRDYSEEEARVRHSGRDLDEIRHAHARAFA